MNVYTENGALSVTPDSPLVEFFYKTLRDLPEDRFEEMFVAAWGVSQLITLRLLFYIRWCRGGKGERRLFRWGLRKLVEMGHSDIVVKNLKWIPEFGSWKDLLHLLETPIREEVLEFYCTQIRKDLQELENPKASVSLAGKWLPSQQKSMDRTFGAAKMFRKALGMSFRDYRITCSSLRSRIDIVERDLCAQNFHEINYATVPSLARLKYAAAFKNHDEERYTVYLRDVAQGRAKMNVKLVYPYQLVEKYMPLASTKNEQIDDATLDTMWTELVKQVRAELVAAGANMQALAVADVSGSMSGVPMANSVSLSLLWAELCEGPFAGHFYTFASRPQLIKVNGDTLREKVETVMKTATVDNTNIQALFDDLLTHAKLWKVSQEQYPKTIYMFTDGQFDQMTDSRRATTNFATIREKHRKAGYEMPRIVFWNLRGDTLDFPASSHDSNVALVSGFSPSLLKLLLESGEMNPVAIMNSAISGKLFEKIII